MTPPNHTTPPNPWGITKAEAAALDAIIATGSAKGAAQQLHRSVKTICTHRDNARSKMHGNVRQLACLIQWDRWRRANPEPEVKP